jgi:Ca2+-transporting ATPase
MFYGKSVDEAGSALGVDPARGLSREEARERLAEYGPNQLTEKKGKSLLMMVVDQLNEPLIYILMGAALVSILLGEISDAIIIGAVVVINAVVGVIQESKAEKSLEALKKMSSPNAIVRRDGEMLEIHANEVVPGDVVLVDAGRIVPCDLRWIESVNLKVEEAALTGESVPSEKDARLVIAGDNPALGDRKNMGYMSTVATYGRGVGIATATGMDTEIGKIATMLDQTEAEETPLQKKLAHFGKKLGIVILALCGFMFVFSVVREIIVDGHIANADLLEFFLTAVSLAVAAIPEGLPAFVTIVLAIGVQKMSKQNAIVRRLPAVETLGSVNVICSDKTGTLTQNKMTVMTFATARKTAKLEDLDLAAVAERTLLEGMALCTDATKSESGETGDPTEVALLIAGARHGIDKTKLEANAPRVSELPFESDRKLMTTVHRVPGGTLRAYTKGATENLLARSTKILDGDAVRDITEDDRKEILSTVAHMSERALRVLGCAYRDYSVRAETAGGEIDADDLGLELEAGLTYVGLVGMIDPPRKEVIGSIEECRGSGIITVMITGDHKDTAFAIAKELGIAESHDQAIAGTEIDAMSDEELAGRTKTLRVFARVSPEHKVRIVKAFRAAGNIVSMTGDGVNDAPSLKSADIGVAMGITGTDVAKGASDMVLMDDNFKTIVRAIREGRVIYDNIKKAILFLLSCNAGEIIAIFTGIMIGIGSPLKPIHILWVNLVTDTLPALALCMDKGDADIMKRKPRAPNESLFAHGGIRFVALFGLWKGFITLLAFVIGLYWYGNEGQGLLRAETMAFAVLAFCQLFHSFNMRHNRKSIFSIGLFSNPWMVGAFVVCAGLQLSVMLIPALIGPFKVASLGAVDWIVVIVLSASPLFLYEVEKFFMRRHERKHGVKK